MFILPGVSFSSPRHPLVRFSRKLRLWSKPTDEGAEMTAWAICAVAWVALFIASAIITRSLGWMLVIGCFVDLLGRWGGIRSRWCFVPIWVLCLVGTLFVTSFKVF